MNSGYLYILKDQLSENREQVKLSLTILEFVPWVSGYSYERSILKPFWAAILKLRALVSWELVE